LVDFIIQEENLSIHRACKLICFTRSTYYYIGTRNDEPVETALIELSNKYPTRGFDTYFGKLRMLGYAWNRKRVLRVYRKLKLGLRRKHKRRFPSRTKEKLEAPALLNDTWSVDFMSDSLENGRRFRVLNVIDDFNREALINEAYYSIPGEQLVRSLNELLHHRGKPKKIRSDNGPEFLSHVYIDFCAKNDIEICYIQPGKPAQNAYIERLNRTFREDVLDAYLFQTLTEVNTLAYDWQMDYNANHPHKSLNGKSPWLYANNRINMSSPDGQVGLVKSIKN